MPSKALFGLVVTLALLAVISAKSGEGLLFTCFATATAVAVSFANKRPELRRAMKIGLGIATVAVFLVMLDEAPWLFGICVVSLGYGVIKANNQPRRLKARR